MTDDLRFGQVSDLIEDMRDGWMDDLKRECRWWVMEMEMKIEEYDCYTYCLGRYSIYLSALAADELLH